MLYGAPPVTPFAGVWIEIGLLDITGVSLLSLPSRECGLKYTHFQPLRYTRSVTPFAGVWIEIALLIRIHIHEYVTPFAGVWIEMFDEKFEYARRYCHSLRGSVD